MKGKFITIEGCEGVGKSTQLAMLKQYFIDNNIQAIFTREPGGTDISEQIRSIILNKDNKQMDDITELMLYTAARRQHTATLIKESIQEGKIVICDRYSDSTLAYQGFARGIDKDMINCLNGYAQGDVNIDMTIFLDLPPVESFARKGGADKNDRLENENINFHNKVYEGYKYIASTQDRVVTIDAHKNAQEVFDDIIKAFIQRGIINGTKVC